VREAISLREPVPALVCSQLLLRARRPSTERRGREGNAIAIGERRRRRRPADRPPRVVGAYGLSFDA
jgi:hypothetical protein